LQLIMYFDYIINFEFTMELGVVLMTWWPICPPIYLLRKHVLHCVMIDAHVLARHVRMRVTINYQ